MLNIIFKYFPDLEESQKQQLAALGDLYADWNKKINVISRKDIDNLYMHHVLHSLAIAKVINFLPCSNILDVGTGGGFPGIPLAIMFPDSNFLLNDSIAKKLKVVDAIAAELGMKNIKTIHSRAEALAGQYDFVVCRAVARLDVVWPLVANLIKPTSANTLPNGMLYLKGGDIANELPKDVVCQRWQLNNFFEEPYFKEKALVLLSKDGQNNNNGQGQGSI